MQVRTGLLELGTGPVIETSAHVSTEKKKWQKTLPGEFPNEEKQMANR